MQQELFLLAGLREDLSAQMISGKIHNSEWGFWKELASIPKYARHCSLEQWKMLQACVALRRKGQQVKFSSVLELLAEAEKDKTAIFPGYVKEIPLEDVLSFAPSSLGDMTYSQLEEFFFAQTKKPLVFKTLYHWCRYELGIPCDKLRLFHAYEVQKILQHYAKTRAKAVWRGIENKHNLKKGRLSSAK